MRPLSHNAHQLPAPSWRAEPRTTSQLSSRSCEASALYRPSFATAISRCEGGALTAPGRDGLQSVTGLSVRRAVRAGSAFDPRREPQVQRRVVGIALELGCLAMPAGRHEQLNLLPAYDLSRHLPAPLAASPLVETP